jgi:hypothetical protein
MTLKLYGARLTAATSGEARTADMPVTRAAQPPIQADKIARNGMHPDAGLMSALDEQLNQAVLFRTKEYFSWYGTLTGVFPTGTADESRWRFAFRTGPYAHAVLAIVGMLPPGGAISYQTSTASRLDIFNGAGAVIASDTFVYGPNPKLGGIVPDAWPHFKTFVKVIDGVSPNTDYTGLFTTQGGKLQSACVAELASLTEDGGYLPQNLTAQSCVLDVYRKNPLLLSNKLWIGGGSKVFNWVADDGTTSGPITRTSATAVNLIDMTSTVISSATPGYTLDMSVKARESQTTGVPCTMKVYGNAPGGGTGTVKLKNSAGTTIATVTINSAIVGWFSTTLNLPASVDKYDLQIAGDGAFGISVYAVNVYEQG